MADALPTNTSTKAPWKVRMTIGAAALALFWTAPQAYGTALNRTGTGLMTICHMTHICIDDNHLPPVAPGYSQPVTVRLASPQDGPPTNWGQGQ